MKVRFGRSIVLVLVACFALVAGGASTASAKLSKSEKKEVKKIAKKYAGKDGQDGARGPAGPAGPAGATGATGPAGPAGGAAPFKFVAIGNTGNQTIATFQGAVAESGCSGGTFNQARLRGTAENNGAEVLNLRTGVFAFDPDLDTGQSITLTPGNADDQFGMTIISANAAQVAEAHYSAYDGAGIAGQYDCAIFGTVSTA
jgi:hypothetical protein